MSVNLDNPVTQCAFIYYSVIYVVPASQPWLSLAIGAIQCLSFSKTFLVLLIPFNIAGLVYVEQ